MESKAYSVVKSGSGSHLRPGGYRRKPVQVARDRRVISDLYLKGWLQADIARHLGVSITTVIKDLLYIQQDWAQQTLTDAGEIIARELAKIDVLEREAWQAWKRSTSVVRVENIERDGIELIETTIIENARDGEPRFLDAIHKCIQQRCKLLGISPDRLELSGPGGKELSIKVIGGIDLDEDI